MIRNVIKMFDLFPQTTVIPSVNLSIDMCFLRFLFIVHSSARWNIIMLIIINVK